VGRDLGAVAARWPSSVFPPAMIAIQKGDQPRLPVLDPHRGDQKRLPRWFEAVFKHAPSHHRVHHARQRHLPGPQLRRDPDRSGTACSAPSSRNWRTRPCRYGVVHNLATFNLLRVAFHEWIGIAADLLPARPRHALGWLFRAPGLEPRRQPGHQSATLKAQDLERRRGPQRRKNWEIAA